jgi:ubiquitin-protein ligase
MKNVESPFQLLEQNEKQAYMYPFGSFNNNHNFFIVMKGPNDTPYENNLFELKIDLPSNYPYSPPVITFVTPIYHPNIKKFPDCWKICLDILKSSWVPSLTLEKTLLSIHSLLKNPNTNDPFDTVACNDFLKNKTNFNFVATEYSLESTRMINEKRNSLKNV